jgi:Flp pilus assembly CpaE family ATPase
VGDELIAEAGPRPGATDAPGGTGAVGDDLPVTEGPSGLLLVQAPRPPDDVPRDAADDAAVLLAVVTITARRADLIVVDLPIDVLVASPALARAAAIVIVTTGHTASIKNALLTAERLDFPPAAGLVLNEISRYPSPAAPEEIAAQVQIPLVAHLPYDHALDRAGSTPERRLVAGSHSHYTHAVGDLARRLVERVAAEGPR